MVPLQGLNKNIAGLTSQQSSQSGGFKKDYDGSWLIILN